VHALKAGGAQLTVAREKMHQDGSGRGASAASSHGERREGEGREGGDTLGRQWTRGLDCFIPWREKGQGRDRMDMGMIGWRSRTTHFTSAT
jgi:hypothetical protein